MRRQKKIPRHVQERIARQRLALAEKREAARRKAVYGDHGAPPDVPSESVRAVSSGFETSRRRH